MRFSTILPSLIAIFAATGLSAADITLLNVSYDPTRELYHAINTVFSASYSAQTGNKLTINQSHGGSGKQARAVIDGLQADVVTLALAYDIDAIATKGKLIEPGWQKEFPHNSSPFSSTIVFLVRKGNPKNLKDWGDLARPGVAVITPNPKTSGGARWNYLAAWGWALRQPDGSDASARTFIKGVLANAKVRHSGARDAAIAFSERNQGDVLLAWENEALLLTSTPEGAAKYDVVVPPLSILAEPTVAIVDVNVDKRGTRTVAKAYLDFLYTPQAQEIGAKNFYRPTNPEVLAKYNDRFTKTELFSIDAVFGGWTKAHADHFSDGGTYDQVEK